VFPGENHQQKGADMNVMQVEARQGRADQEVTDLLVLLLSQGDTIFKQEAASINTLLGGHLQTLLEQREFEGKLNETLLMHTHGKTSAKRVLLVGLGMKKEMGLDAVRQALGSAVKRVRQAKITSFAAAMPAAMPRGATALEVSQAMAEGAHLATKQLW
jgi:leucyl aminopeptidase